MLTEPKRLTFNIPIVAQPDSTHRVLCYQWGDEHAPRTVFCVHGLTRNGRDFDFLAEALAAGYRVLAPDIVGRGISEWLKNPAGYNYATYMADIGFILASLHLTQVDWVGTSMGGILGMMMANNAPSLIRALVLNDVGCLIPASGMERIKSLADIQTVFTTRAEAEASFRKRTATFGIHEEAHWQHLFTHGLQDTPDGRTRFAYDPAIFLAGFPKGAPVTDVNLWGLWEMVKKIPVLLIRGGESDILPLHTAEQMKALHPNLTLCEIPHCGHAPALMEESQTMMIKNWLDVSAG